MPAARNVTACRSLAGGCAVGKLARHAVGVHREDEPRSIASEDDPRVVEVPQRRAGLVAKEARPAASDHSPNVSRA